jgi:hypothetical protein
MFGIIDQFLYKNLHDWIKHSINLLKPAQAIAPEPINFTRKKQNEALKQAIADTGLPETTEISRFRSNISVIKDLIKHNDPQAMDQFDHCYKTLTSTLNTVTKKNKTSIGELEGIEKQIKLLN